MKIKHLKVYNYRNLNNATVNFELHCNFIVGENNLGKSNFLSLLNILFSSRAFHFDDFKDPELPIKVEFQLELQQVELGHFQDLFDTTDYSKINLVARQLNSDENIEFYHQETNTYIPSSIVRCINYVHYDSLRNPISEINFDKGRGVGRFLKNIIAQYLTENGITESDFLDTPKVDGMLRSINSKISKIKSFQDFDIAAVADEDPESLLSKIVVLKDEKGDHISNAGYGVQFLILVILSILEKIHYIKLQRKERGIFENEKNRHKVISLVLGLDEPEIHLHPYMQRSLVKFLCSVVSNQNADFQQLVKDLFDIDEFTGQIIIVTHSPQIILNDFRQIIRFYCYQGTTHIISGNNLTLTEQLQKHLYLHFPFIKEAFFSRCAIFVEGDSEYSSFPLFGQKLSLDFDDLGICVIKANGDSIAQLIELAELFGIPAVGVTDKDDGTHPPTRANLYETNYRDFEEELVVPLVDRNKQDVLRKIIISFDTKGDQRIMEAAALNKKAVKKYAVPAANFSQGLKLADIDQNDKEHLKAFYLTWFGLNKSYPLGKLIGEELDAVDLPSIYVHVIQQAKTLVQNANS